MAALVALKGGMVEQHTGLLQVDWLQTETNQKDLAVVSGEEPHVFLYKNSLGLENKDCQKALELELVEERTDSREEHRKDSERNKGSGRTDWIPKMEGFHHKKKQQLWTSLVSFLFSSCCKPKEANKGNHMAVRMD